MQNNARRIRTRKILRKPEIEAGDMETLKSLKRNRTCHKIPHNQVSVTSGLQGLDERLEAQLFYSERSS